jgi:dihydrolipoamide dehydrogenase
VRDSYDVIVLGAGPTGENVADRAVRGGLTAAVVESELVGGECSYWACMPSKALLRSGAALAEARRVDGARQAVTGQLDVRATLARRDSFTSHWHDDGQVSWLNGAGIDLLRGQGRISGPRTVTVTSADGARTITANHAVVVCTGSEAVLPEIPGLAEADPWTSRDATSAMFPPERLAIVGGGVVGCEMAAAWATLGSRVTLLVRGDRLLPRMEAFAGDLVRVGLNAQGVVVRSGVGVDAVDREVAVTLTLSDGSALTTDEVLFATGRRPRTDDIGLDTVGAKPGANLEIDTTGRVRGVPDGWLYAAGDVTGDAPLTHMGKYTARAVGDVIAARAAGRTVEDGPWQAHATTALGSAVPQVIFTDPEVAQVGMTEGEAVAAGYDVHAVEFDTGNVAGAALYADDFQGHAKIVVDTARRVLLGATFAGPGSGELLHSATVAVVGAVPIDRLWHAVPSYPTISEVWLRLLETYPL